MMPPQSTTPHGDEMTVDEFKEWIKQFDTNGDGSISKDELRKAIRSLGKRFSGWRSARGIRKADRNHDGVISDDEITYLVAFAQKTLGMKIAPY